MNVLGIYGSPRKGGNTDVLLDRILEGAKAAGAQVDTVYCRKLKVSGCVECGGCDDTGECVIQDDMQGVYEQLEWADRIVFATPIFFYGPPAQAKAPIDRCQAMWSKRLLNKTPEQRKAFDSGQGYLVAAGATKGKNLFEPTELVAKYFYDALDMSYEGGLLYRGLEAKGDVDKQEDKLDEAFSFGKNLAGA